MIEMIERVAQALCVDFYKVNWELTSEFRMGICRSMARVAIEAMREPTEAMEQAYYAACDVNGMCLWKHGYRTMIDEALK